MIDLIHHSLHRRPHWKHRRFDELSELYASITIRTFAVSLIGIFIPIYLYQLDHTIAEIAYFHILVYGIRFIADPIIVRLVGRLGPKHVMAISSALMVVSLGFLVTLPTYEWPLLFVAPLFGISIGTFFIPFFTDFSNNRKAEREGHQLGALFVLEKFAGAMGPLAGGGIALLWGIQSTIFLSMLLIIVSSVPLYASKEKSSNVNHAMFRYRDLIVFKKFLPVSVAMGAETVATSMVWPLLVSIVVFSENVYLGVGFITTVSLFVSVASSVAIGKLLDKKKIAEVVNFSSIGLFFINIARTFVSSIAAALTINLSSEPFSGGARMTFLKATMDQSDGLGKDRIRFVAASIFYINMTRVALWLAILLGSYFVGEVDALKLCLLLAALASFCLLRVKRLAS